MLPCSITRKNTPSTCLPAVVGAPVVWYGATSAHLQAGGEVGLWHPAVVAGSPPGRGGVHVVDHRGRGHLGPGRLIQLHGVSFRRHVGPQLAQGIRGVRVVVLEVHDLLLGG